MSSADAGPSVPDSEIDFSDIIAKYAVRFDEGLDDVVVLDNVPVITQERQTKLFDTIIKRFKTHAGIDVPPEGMHIPYGEDGNSKG